MSRESDILAAAIVAMSSTWAAYSYWMAVLGVEASMGVVGSYLLVQNEITIRHSCSRLAQAMINCELDEDSLRNPQQLYKTLSLAL